MSDARPKWLALAQLMRLPNLFTAVADPLAGWLVVGGGSPAWQVLLLVGASGCLYTSGLVFNDCFDYHLDRQFRPERPLPRGDIARATAAWLASGLMVAGLALAAAAGRYPFAIAVFLAVMIFFYNAWAKRFVALGPLTLGVCRAANFALGMRYAPPTLWWMPGVLGGYVTTLSFIARQEELRPDLRLVVKRLLLGIIVVDGLLVALQGDFYGAALVTALLVPAVCLGRAFQMT
jgi:4-hydroxybenzoate polyprenyltransferase